MKIKPFALERYFAKYEFVQSTFYPAQNEPIMHSELLALADSEISKLYNNLSLGYTQSAGHPLLIAEISKLYENILANNILTIAPQEGIFIALNSILDTGAHMISIFPGYQSLYEVGLSIGCEVSYWNAKYNIKGAYFNIDDMISLVRPNTKLIVINFPHNPTGYSPTIEEFMHIVDIARKNNIILLSDEMYRLLERENKYKLPNACDVYENGVSLFGLSKSFGLPGLRIGWLCTQNNKMMDTFKKYKDYTTICSSAPSEILAIIALRAKDSIIDKNKKLIQKNLQLLQAYFEENAHIFQYYKPIAGTTCYPKLREDINLNKFCLDLIDKQEVMLLHSKVYGDFSNRFRVGYGKKSIQEALIGLAKYTINNYAKD